MFCYFLESDFFLTGSPLKVADSAQDFCWQILKKDIVFIFFHLFYDYFVDFKVSKRFG